MASEGQDRADALGWGRCPNRPKTFARYHTIPQKVTNVSIYDKEPGSLSGSRPCLHAQVRPRRRGEVPAGLCATKLTFWPLNVVNGHLSIFKAHPDAGRAVF